MKIAIVINKSWNIYNFRMGLIKLFQELGHSIVAIAPEDEFTPNLINISLVAGSNTALVVQQNFYPHWYYEIKENKRPVQMEGINFMHIPVDKGVNNIIVSFEPTLVRKAMLFSCH